MSSARTISLAFFGNISSRLSHRDSYIRPLDCKRVVYSVSSNANYISFFLKNCNKAQFIFGFTSCKTRVYDRLFLKLHRRSIFRALRLLLHPLLLEYSYILCDCQRCFFSLSPVTMIVMIPAFLAFITASFASSLGGSYIPTNPRKSRFFSR